MARTRAAKPPAGPEPETASESTPTELGYVGDRRDDRDHTLTARASANTDDGYHGTPVDPNPKECYVLPALVPPVLRPHIAMRSLGLGAAVGGPRYPRGVVVRVSNGGNERMEGRVVVDWNDGSPLQEIDEGQAAVVGHDFAPEFSGRHTIFVTRIVDDAGPIQLIDPRDRQGVPPHPEIS
jgi:hypothetical protein